MDKLRQSFEWSKLYNATEMQTSQFNYNAELHYRIKNVDVQENLP